MNHTEAQALREAAAAAVRRYSRMTAAQLRTEHTAALEAAGIEHVYGGPVSKDELISDTLQLRGFGTARLNEAIHVLYHETVWPDCGHCQVVAVTA